MLEPITAKVLTQNSNSIKIISTTHGLDPGILFLGRQQGMILHTKKQLKLMLP